MTISALFCVTCCRLAFAPAACRSICKPPCAGLPLSYSFSYSSSDFNSGVNAREFPAFVDKEIAACESGIPTCEGRVSIFGSGDTGGSGNGVRGAGDDMGPLWLDTGERGGEE